LDGQPAPADRVHSDLDQIAAAINAKTAAPDVTGSRVIIGEYGFQYNANHSNFADLARDDLTSVYRYLTWPGGTLRFILQWQFYDDALKDNGDPKEFAQIGDQNDLRPRYFAHENFYREMRRWVSDRYLLDGVLPSAAAFEAQAAYVIADVSLQEYQPVLSFSTYDQWREFHYIDAAESGDTAVSGPAADPHNSGVPNLLRYGFGLNKFQQAGSQMPYLRLESGSWNYAFPYDPGKTDLRWKAQADSSLSLWNLSLFDSATDAGVPVDGWLEVNADGLVDPGDPVFYRLELELLP
jgi:hypothetical protein